MKIFWYPTLNCNNYHYKCCPYCHEYTVWKTMSSKDTDPQMISSLSQKLIFFLNMNKQEEINITGGEPLFTPLTMNVLSDVSNIWVMNSNSQMFNSLKDFLKNVNYKFCKLWNASYHPFSSHKKKFSQSIELLLKYNIPIKINYVCSWDTLPLLKKSIQNIHSMSKDIHIDIIKEIDLLYLDPPKFDQKVDQIIQKSSHTNLTYYRGQKVDKSHSPKLCSKNHESIIIGPNGHIYPCITCFYLQKDLIGKIQKPFLLSSLPEKLSICTLSCWRFHQLDKVKR